MISLGEAIEQTNADIASALHTVSNDLGELISYLGKSSGKGVRMRLLLAAAMNADGLVPENAVRAAAAVELLHMATLVHDDVIDDTPIRRGIETVQKKFGKKNAVIGGDYLLCMSLNTLAGMQPDTEQNAEWLAPLLIRFSRALSSICLGEYTQNQHSGDLEMNLATYLRIIAGKTAALFYISTFLGALVGGEDEESARALGRFGQRLGIAFQIADDCKDYELSEAEALKPVGNDISGGVITLPLIIALKRESALRDLALEAMRGKEAASRLVAEVRRLDGGSGAREILRHFDKKARLALRNIMSPKREYLLGILDKALSVSSKS
ncbi:MAG: polyprenyl synthetase family protein [Treponema sp.]|nr:polyprenyl synthetase family protein [Treponema sp.]